MGSDNVHLAFTGACTLGLVVSMALYSEVWLTYQAPLLMLLMSATHYMLYPYIWFYPQHYMQFVAGDRGVEFYRDFVFVQKFAIMVLTAAYWLDMDLFFSTLETQNGKLFYAFCLALVLLGTHLNAAVYGKIGANGVYYGFKMGKHVPWVTGYPFTIWRHPQYTGAALIYAGYALLVNYLSAGVWVTILFQCWAYAVTGIMEESSDNETEQEKVGAKKGSSSSLNLLSSSNANGNSPPSTKKPRAKKVD